MRGKLAFTLFELLVVIPILANLIGFLQPRHQRPLPAVPNIVTRQSSN